MYCRNCGQPIVPEAEFCTNCGARPKAGNSFCPGCGTTTAELAEICVKCGTKLTTLAPDKILPISPGVISAYKFGWKKLWPSFWILVLVGLVSSAISGGPGFIGTVAPFLSILSIFVSIPLSYGQSYCYLNSVKTGQVKFEDLFIGFKHYWNSIGAGVLSSLIILGGFILLIVPGIIFACKLAFVPYLVIELNLGPTEAIKTSWNMTSGHTGKVFLICLLAIPIIIAGFLCLIIGVVVSVMWIYSAQASLYYAVSQEPANRPTQNV